MQNQNIHSWSWGQNSASAFASAQSILSTNFPPPGVDQNSLLSGYPSMYANASGQPLPGYSQWTSTQFQQWQQWQQWQEKYEQWQAQYGKKYVESLAALGQNPNVLIPGLPPVAGVPKPVEPVSINNPSVANPPLPVNTQPVPPPPPDEEKPPLPFSKVGENGGDAKLGIRSAVDNPEELSEAEKTFDIQFKQWEGQFNEWKKQNQDHPDKAQYREYEKKWETWREQLLQRREQMRKKRLNKSTESTNDGKIDEIKSKSLLTPTPTKLADADYSYKTRPNLGTGPASVSVPVSNSEPADQSPVGSDSSKFENKVPFFEGNVHDIQSGLPPLSNFGHHNSHQKGLYSSSSFGTFKTSSEKMDTGRQGGSLPNIQNLNKNQASNFEGNFEKGIGNISSNTKFENFQKESKSNDFPSNTKFKNSGFDGPRFGGSFDNFGGRQRFTDDRNFGPPSRFSGENFRNERDFFNQQRFSDMNREKGFGSSENAPGRGGNKMDLGDFRSGNAPSDLKNVQNLQGKPKVPSLFDITVEKPPGLSGGSNNDRKSKVWDKYEKDDYYEHPFEKRQEERENERNDKSWTKSNVWNKNTTSPWMQPWEMEKLATQKANEMRSWERNHPTENKTWLSEGSGKQDIDKAELSGYVGNILAKLGNFNVMPPNLGKNENTQEKLTPQGTGEVSDASFSDNNKVNNRSKGIDSERYKVEDTTLKTNSPQSSSGDSSIKTQSRMGPAGNFEAKDFDQRDNDCIEGLRDRHIFPPINFDHLNESKKDTDERLRFDGEPKNFDVDERIPTREDRSLFRRDERSEKNSFNRDENRSLTRPTFRENQRNFGNEDKFFGRDDRSFDRTGRDERIFGRFSVRDDGGDRFGNRNRRRAYDRLDRDDRDGRFFERQGVTFDRFGRNRDQPEPVWNPQVFDYSQGRPQKVTDFNEDFKISTVVDYSHGEKKQTFDYGHGEAINNELEIRSFDYGHKNEAPSVIDYGHGVEKDLLFKDFRRDRPPKNGEQDIDERIKLNLGAGSPIRRRSRSPRGRLRSHSRSPHSKFKKESVSPPFRGNQKGRDRLGKPLFRRDRNGSAEGKSSPPDGDPSRHSFDIMTVLVEDLICLPGRETRPNKLVFIMRGIPGSGKTYVTKLIKDKEVELGGDPPRILSLDDYFMTEVEKEIIDKETGRKVKNKVMEYEYEAGMEPHYKGSLLKAFKKTVSDGFFSFIIVDSVNEKTKDYEEMWSFAKQKGFQVYIAEMDNDVTICKSRNIHKRTEKEITDLIKSWEQTPSHYLRLDVRSLIQSDAITEVEMEVVSDTELEKTIGKDETEEIEESEKTCKENVDNEEKKNAKDEEDEDETGVTSFVKSRWDQFENSEQNLDRLDGLKRRREGFHATMEEYLQLPDELDSQEAELAPGKKKVRWADLEERRQQEKMRAIGFVVGQTDWNRMTDPTFGENALTRTKYI